LQFVVDVGEECGAHDQTLLRLAATVALGPRKIHRKSDRFGGVAASTLARSDRTTSMLE
jgi:hypothetical protein